MNDREHKTLLEIPIHSAGSGEEQERATMVRKRDEPFVRAKRLVLIGCMLVMAMLAGALAWYSRPAVQQYSELARLMDRILANRYHKVLTAPFVLKQGADLDAARFLVRLNELGYRRNSDKNCRAGEFFTDGGELYLCLHPRMNGSPTRIVLYFKGSVVSRIIDLKTGRELDSISLEPLALTSFIDRIWEIRVPVSYGQIPRDLINAVLATEDQKFFHHPGVDGIGILRAAWVNFRAGHVVQGGSTITQQLVKTLLHRRERSLEKKYEEALLALALEWRYSKKQLLTAYLNNVYLGTSAPFEIRGMGAAAQYIFGKNLEDLDLAECALLGGLIRSPNSASPFRHPEKAKERAATVLDQMARLGDRLAGEISAGKRLPRIRYQGLLHQQSWFFDQLEKELKLKRFLPARFAEGQLIIHTTLDPWIQATAYRKLQQVTARLERRKKLAKNSLQGGIVVVDPATGGIRALVGGRDYLKSPFNRAVLARRQIGSLIKPFIYLAALGGMDVHGVLTQATLLNDHPLRINNGGRVWKPHNYDRKYKGYITARRALVESRNIPAILVGQKVGLAKIVSLIQELGINEHPARVPSLFLGACESSPVRMAGAFAAIANGGKKTVSHLVRTVFRDGKKIWTARRPEPVLAPAPCFVVTDMLRQVMLTGTARRSGTMGFHQIAAGKTGTTNRLRDSWFAGYTPSLVTVCWVGRDDHKPSRLTGSTGALPLWVAIMKTILGASKPEPFTATGAVEFAGIDPRNGKRAVSSTPGQVTMAFVRGTVPSTYSLPAPAGTRPGEHVAVAPAGKRNAARKRSGRAVRPAAGKSPEQASRPWLMSQLKKTVDWFKR